MQSQIPRLPVEFVVPLNMNGLRGRMLRLPAKKNKKREILLIYDRQSSLESIYGLAEFLNDYGSVTLPDMPGFGGMDSFYRIGEKPDLDTMADYLASIIKLRYRGRQLTLVGVGYGLAVITRMLQRYPFIARKTSLLVSVAGFAHNEDLKYSRARKNLLKVKARFLAMRLPSMMYRNIFLHPSVIKRTRKDLFKGRNAKRNKFKIYLSRTNDVRTQMIAEATLLNLDNCRKRISLPVWHIGVKGMDDLDNNLVEQHLSVAFENFHTVKTSYKQKLPDIIAAKADYSKIFPRKIRGQLNKNK